MSRAERRIAALAPARVAAVVVAILLVDQLTKRVLVGSLREGQVDTILPFLDLVHVRNEGIAFSAFSGSPRLVALLVSLALLVLVVWFVRHRERPWAWLATGLLAGGAFGNILDRLIEGAVIDFVKFPKWPAFNLSDTSIVVGMLVLVLVVEGTGDRRPKSGGDGDDDERPGRDEPDRPRERAAERA